MINSSIISRIMSDKCETKTCKIRLNTSSTCLMIYPYFNALGEMIFSDYNRYSHSLYCESCNKSMSVAEYLGKTEILQEVNCNDD